MIHLNSNNENIVERLNTASKSTNTSLTIKQYEHFVQLASDYYSKADLITRPEIIIARLDADMRSFISKSGKITAICDSEKEMRKLVKQVKNYQDKSEKLLNNIDEEMELINEGRITREASRIMDLTKEEALAEQEKPTRITKKSWEAMKALYNNYLKYKISWEKKREEIRKMKSPEELGEELDERMNNNSFPAGESASPLTDITCSNNSVCDNNNNKQKLDRGESSKSKKQKIEEQSYFNSGVRAKAAAEKKKEAEERELTMNYIKAATERIAKKNELADLQHQYLLQKMEFLQQMKNKNKDNNNNNNNNNN